MSKCYCVCHTPGFEVVAPLCGPCCDWAGQRGWKHVLYDVDENRAETFAHEGSVQENVDRLSQKLGKPK